MIDKVPIALDQVESIFEIAFVKNGFDGQIFRLTVNYSTLIF